MLIPIALGVGALVTGFLGFAATRPGEFSLERSTRIDTTPDRILPLIEDFRKWTAWSPWEQLDPDLKRTYSGTQQGRGAVYEWEGNPKAGKGRMEITATRTHEVDINIDFLKPFEAHNKVVFVLTPQDGGTNIT